MLDIQVVGRLVQQQHLRPLCQGSGDVHALALAPGQRPPKACAQVQSVEVGQGLLDDHTVFPGERRQHRQPGGAAQGNGIEHADRIEGVGLLFDQRQGLGDTAAGQLCQRFAQQLHTAVAWLAQPGQHLQQRGLAGTVGADDAQGFTGDNAQFDIAEHGIAGQLQPQVLATQGGQL